MDETTNTTTTTTEAVTTQPAETVQHEGPDKSFKTSPREVLKQQIIDKYRDQLVTTDTDEGNEQPSEQEAVTEGHDENVEAELEDKPRLSAAQRALAKREQKLLERHQEYQKKFAELEARENQFNEHARNWDPAINTVRGFMEGIEKQDADAVYESLKTMNVTPSFLLQLLNAEQIDTSFEKTTSRETEALKKELATLRQEREQEKQAQQTAQKTEQLRAVLNNINRLTTDNSYEALQQAFKADPKVYDRVWADIQTEFLSYDANSRPDDDEIYDTVLKSYEGYYSSRFKPSKKLPAGAVSSERKRSVGSTVSKSPEQTKPKTREELRRSLLQNR